MFPLDPTDELFQFNTAHLPRKRDYSRQRKSSVFVGDKDDYRSDKKKGKMTHRDVERQRRQEMAVLYASLRSLVSNEHLKVTRSVSDHIYETVNYIRHLQDKIQELSDKRDCLKKLSNTSNNVAPDCPTSCLECSCVTVELCWAGVEVLVTTGFTQGLPLSRVLSVLTSEGLSIVSCSSTKVNGMLLHSIESEVNDGRSIDVSELQQKLADLKVKTSSKILKW
ncbi:hypothetical protein PVL29_001931 [Vitis rotundifolia]|uniref:BHLH domain-containing protein n=1 Tax=Vitis rotundifolia TaxID=103349 RepID=A0AA39AGQ5_VITRO|nr:hypothetical protein PVL29_001931 [Vitis rotundifolia]